MLFWAWRLRSWFMYSEADVIQRHALGYLTTEFNAKGSYRGRACKPDCEVAAKIVL